MVGRSDRVGSREWRSISLLMGGLTLLTLFSAASCAHYAVSKADRMGPGPFKLGPDDVIEVSVYKDPDLSRIVPVRPDGMITLPIVGDIVAAGRTPEQVRAEVAQKLHRYVQDPTVVSVIVHEVHSAKFYVVGEVMKPGAYPLHGPTNVLQALADAGGAGEYSARDRATVVRANTGEHVVVDLTDPESAGVLLLRPGDTVVVR